MLSVNVGNVVPSQGTGFMLVHGGGHDARCWAPVAPLLKGPIKAIDLPGRGTNQAALKDIGVKDFIATTIAEIDQFRVAERLIVVGHSMAGILLPQVVAQRPHRIAHLVLLSCFVPEEGASIADDMPRWMRLAIRFAAKCPPAPMPSFIAKRSFCNGMTEDQTRFALRCLVPEAPNIIFETVSRQGLPPSEEIPRTYIRLTKDRALPPLLQQRFIERLGQCDVQSIDACHNAMISVPSAVADALNRIKRNADLVDCLHAASGIASSTG